MTRTAVSFSSYGVFEHLRQKKGNCAVIQMQKLSAKQLVHSDFSSAQVTTTRMSNDNQPSDVVSLVCSCPQTVHQTVTLHFSFCPESLNHNVGRRYDASMLSCE